MTSGAEWVEWSDIKTFLVNRPLVILQYLEFSTHYKIKAGDNFFIVETVIQKTSPASADQSDFENNYKASANKPITSYVVPTESRSDYVFEGDVMEFDFACPAVGAGPATSTLDFLLANETGITGGMSYFYENADARDSIKFSLIDKDGVLEGVAYPPGTPLPVTLKLFLKKWRITPNQLVSIKNASASYTPVGGLYLRAEITHHVENNTGGRFKGYINLDLWPKP